MKVLFLGNNHDSVSISCLESILADETLIVLVGIHSQERKGIYRALVTGFQRYGLWMLMSKCRHMAGSLVVDRFRRLGFPVKRTTSLQSLAETRRLEHFVVRDVNSTDSHARIMAFQPELIVIATFSQILKPHIINAPPLGCINIHPSLLPKYRGPTPEYWILQNKETVTGVTIHFIDEGIDTGDIILQKEILIEGGETVESLVKKCTSLGASMLIEALQVVRGGKVERRKQNEQEATYYSFPRLQFKGKRN